MEGWGGKCEHGPQVSSGVKPHTDLPSSVSRANLPVQALACEPLWSWVHRKPLPVSGPVILLFSACLFLPRTSFFSSFALCF